MSLDITLYNAKKITCDCGRVHELETEIVYDSNITHNLCEMAEEAGIYDPIWNGHLSGIGIESAGELGNILNIAVRHMDLNPEYYKKFNASNGWGTYEQFVPWLEELRDKCLEYPNAKIEVSK